MRGEEGLLRGGLSRGVLLEHPKFLWENDAGLGYNTHGWKTIEVQGWMAEIGASEHYVMMNGDQSVEW